MLIESYNFEANLPISGQEFYSSRLAIAYVAGVCANWHLITGTITTAQKYIYFGQEALEFFILG